MEEPHRSADKSTAERLAVFRFLERMRHVQLASPTACPAQRVCRHPEPRLTLPASLLRTNSEKGILFLEEEVSIKESILQVR